MRLDSEPVNAMRGDECRVLFNTVVKQRDHRILLLENLGTTVLYYRWQHIDRPNELGRLQDDTQRFFLDFEPGVVLPGDCKELSIAYVSPNAGVFSEAWRLLVQPWPDQTFPVLSLCGVTDRVDHNQLVRNTLQVNDRILWCRFGFKNHPSTAWWILHDRLRLCTMA